MLVAISNANGQTYQQDKTVLSGGLGFGNYYGSGLPFWATGEYGITKNISAGGQLAYVRWTDSYSGGAFGVSYSGKWTYTATVIAARGSYHFADLIGIDDIVDLYGGLALGYVSASSKWEWESQGFVSTTVAPVSSVESGTYLGIYAGARYYFNKNKNFAANAEIGYNLSPLNLGVSYRF